MPGQRVRVDGKEIKKEEEMILLAFNKPVGIVLSLIHILQAYCDLSLPQYTSDIIDVGIQNKGIKHILPEKMPEEEYQLAELFMTDGEKDTFEAVYEKKDDTYVCTCLLYTSG